MFESRGQAPSNIPVANVDLDLDQGDDVEMDSTSDSDSSSDSSDSTSSQSTSDSDSEAAPIPPSTTTEGQAPSSRAIKPLPARAQGRNPRNEQGITPPKTRPEIVVLSENNDADRSSSP